MELLDQLCREMIAYDKGDPRRIHHFLKVHAFAEQIGREEGIPEKQLFVLEAAGKLGGKAVFVFVGVGGHGEGGV